MPLVNKHETMERHMAVIKTYILTTLLLTNTNENSTDDILANTELFKYYMMCIHSENFVYDLDIWAKSLVEKINQSVQKSS